MSHAALEPSILVEGGRPPVVEDDSDRIGAGLVGALARERGRADELSARAQAGADARVGRRGRLGELGPGRLSARVAGSTGNLYSVSIEALTVPARVWQETLRSARGRPGLATAVQGATQSVHLGHLMSTEHGVRLHRRP